jgi:hypothetical protein
MTTIRTITVTVGATIQARQYEPLHVEVSMIGDMQTDEDAQEVAGEIYAEARRALRYTLSDTDNPNVQRWMEATMLKLPDDQSKSE